MAATLKQVLAQEPPFWRPFFRPGDARSLNLFRFLYCMGLYFSLMFTRDRYRALLAAGQYNPIPMFEHWGLPLFTPIQFKLLYYTLMTLLLLGAIGWKCRAVFPTAAIAYFFYMGTALGLTKSPFRDYVFHSSNIIIPILIILGLSDKVGLWGVDGLRKRKLRWSLAKPSDAVISPLPLLAIKGALAIAYFGAGYCKMVYDPRWPDGYTLQAYLLQKYLIVDTEYGFWLAQSWAACLFFGIMTIWLELTFGVLIFFPKLEWIYVISGLCLHASILLTMKINFFLYFGLTYLVFIDWPRFKWFLHQLDRPLRKLRGDPPLAFDWNSVALPEGPPRRPSKLPFGHRSFRHYAIVALLCLLISNVGMRVESWPFTDYRVFEQRKSLSNVRVYRLAGVDASGHYRWLTRRETAVNAVALNSRTRWMYNGKDKGPVLKLLQGVADAMPPLPKSDFKKLVIVRRMIKQNPNGEFTPVDTNFAELPL